jgi:hypothetical protein
MDEYDVMVVDERNALPAMRRPTAMTRVHAGRPWPPRPYYPPPAPYYRPPPQQRPIVIVQRPSLLAGIDLGDVVEHGVSLLAAMQSLPGAPTITGDPGKDVGNMILYQESLADHAKSDERVRTFGALVAQVVKALVKNSQQRSSVAYPGA